MDNTVGSLTQFQKSIILGSILGDGYIRIFPGRKDALIEINHSAKQKDYVDWKYSMLKDVAGSPPKMRRGNGKRIAYRFYTKQLPEISSFLHIFYKDGKKIIPEELRLDDVSLAVWYMDDGSKCGTYNYYLNTQQFRLEDQKKLLEALCSLELKATLNRDKSYWRIRFLTSTVPRLKALIGERIIPSMRYKIGL